jgi:DNA-binding phage protein
MRRLFTTAAPNPTLATILSILRAIDYSLALVPASGAGRTKPKGKDQ